MEYQIVRLMDKPEMKEQMANWFSEKWSVPLQAYLDSMEDCLSRTKPVPGWYVAIENSRIIGGLGVSGGTEEQDTALAEYGKLVFEKGSK